jgi:hypothetical protein
MESEKKLQSTDLFCLQKGKGILFYLLGLVKKTLKVPRQIRSFLQDWKWTDKTIHKFPRLYSVIKINLFLNCTLTTHNHQKLLAKFYRFLVVTFFIWVWFLEEKVSPLYIVICSSLNGKYPQGFFFLPNVDIKIG